jgi:hypothetical protein
VTQALGFRLGRRYGNGDSQLEARSRPTGGAMTSRSSTAAAGGPAPRCGGGLPPRCGGGLPPGARTLGATASHGLGAVAVARRSACVPAAGRCACLPVREAGVGLLCWSRWGAGRQEHLQPDSYLPYFRFRQRRQKKNQFQQTLY